MKKILFTLLIVAGMFIGQAQDDSIKRFRFKSNEASSFLDRNHLFSEDFDHCNGNVIDATDVNIFTYNATERQLYFNGASQGPVLTVRRGKGFANLFALTYNTVNVTTRRNKISRALTYNEATDTWE